jgi:hypothetical protein
MPGRLSTAFLLAVLAAPVAAPVAAQSRVRPCDHRAKIVAQLAEMYHEMPVGHGLQIDGNLLQLFVSAETGTWTLVSTTPAGLSCLVGAGRSWEMMAPPDVRPRA